MLLAGGASLATLCVGLCVLGPRRADIETFFQARGAGAERRIGTFRLAWDFVGSTLAGRGELYERFYLQDSFRMTALAYLLADKGTRGPGRALPARRLTVTGAACVSDWNDDRLDDGEADRNRQRQEGVSRAATRVVVVGFEATGCPVTG